MNHALPARGVNSRNNRGRRAVASQFSVSSPSVAERLPRFLKRADLFMRSEISASFGNRPRLFLEKRIFPAYSTSNRPAAEPTTSAGTPKLFVSSAARLTARDLCLQVEQYVILNLSSISLTPYFNKGLEWPSLPVEQPQCNPCRLAVLVPEGNQIVKANVRHRRKEYKEAGSVLNVSEGGYVRWPELFPREQVETVAL